MKGLLFFDFVIFWGKIMRPRESEGKALFLVRLITCVCPPIENYNLHIYLLNLNSILTTHLRKQTI